MSQALKDLCCNTCINLQDITELQKNALTIVNCAGADSEDQP